MTEGRQEFIPWLLWNFDRQTYARRELVIVDSSAEPFRSERADVRVVSEAVGANVPTKRNRALESARGSIVAWFDDDDWQHPERLESLVGALNRGFVMAGVSQGWFVDLFTGRSTRHGGIRQPLFNGAGFAIEIARSVRFDERAWRGSDLVWMRALGAAEHRSVLLDPLMLSLWLCHNRNISNPRRSRRFATPPGALRDALGADAWGETDEQLGALRERLTTKATERRGRRDRKRR